MVHIKLTTIKQQLQAIMHYPEDPSEAQGCPTLDQAFDTLLFGFMMQELKLEQSAYAAKCTAQKRHKRVVYSLKL